MPKIRESGMPKEEQWESFFDPAKILRMFGLDKGVFDVADFGCGYGTFTLPAAGMVKGKIYAFDIEPAMIKAVEQKAKHLRRTNVVQILRDFISEGSGLGDLTVDFVMLFNILHVETPVNLLKEAHRILRPGGTVGIIHWIYDASTPRGPPMAIRPKPEQCRRWAELAGFTFERQIDLKPYHYALLLRK